MKALLHFIVGIGWLISFGLGVTCIVAAILNEFYPGGFFQACKDAYHEAVAELDEKHRDREDAREDEIRREEFFDRE